MRVQNFWIWIIVFDLLYDMVFSQYPKVEVAKEPGVFLFTEQSQSYPGVKISEQFCKENNGKLANLHERAKDVEKLGNLISLCEGLCNKKFVVRTFTLWNRYASF